MIPSSVIVTATENFDEKYFIGSGGFGEVYKAKLNISDIESCYGKKLSSRCDSSTMMHTVAIKRLNVENTRGRNNVRSAFAELDALCQCEDPNIVTLLAYCEDDKEILLVYEYASNGSLDDHFNGTIKEISFRQWTQRLKICIDIAKGLEYLHTNTEAKRAIVHRDIKSENILLFENMKAKIAAFGRSKVHIGQESTINTKSIVGTPCYIDPEYMETGRLKKASDIYSFGVVLFEIFSGKIAYDNTYFMQNHKGLAPIARRHFKNKTLKELLDVELADETSELGLTFKVRPHQDSLDVFSNIAYQSLSTSQDKRPTIQAVIQDLEKALEFQESRLRINKFSLEHIKEGTNNFSVKGGHGMYEGTIQGPNGHINVLLRRFTNQEHGFLKEIEFLFKYKHDNILGLLGYSKEMDESIIVYEDASKGCLNKYLDDTSFSWTQRLKVCIDIARGLKFLHEDDIGQDVVIHRDIKSSNILLTMDWKAKIYGFKDAPNDDVGSAGYLDPSYYHTNDSTKESYIYSFGVVLFEILCGRMTFPEKNSDDKRMLEYFVKSHNEAAQIEEIVFEELKKHIVHKSFTTFRRIAIQCLHEKREERPRADDVLLELQKALKFLEKENHMEEQKVKEEFMIPRSVIVTATENFDKKYFIGSGSFGEVYKAKLNLSDIESCYGKKLRSRCNSSTMTHTVAIKRLNVENARGRNNVLSAFAELDALCQCDDPNIVTLLAYCQDDKETLLVYEYASNGSLEDQLQSTNKEISFRQWTQRLKICIDIAKGLEYLHTSTEAKRVIVHRDIKSGNILLFENMKAKIADFGLSKVHIGQESTINTIQRAGTPYYIDQEYMETGILKKASDIYSFGVVLFEIFSGKLAYDDTYTMQNHMGLAAIARSHFQNKTLKKMLDAKLMDEACELGLMLKVRPDQDSLAVFSNIAYQCLSRSQDKRPKIQAVLQDLEKALLLQENRMKTHKFSLEGIKQGTNNFSDDKCILKGDQEMLYEGTIDQDPNGLTNVLIKRFTNQEHGFLKEFEVLFRYKHENILGLFGYSKEMDERIIVYEHASKGCLNRYLKDTSFSWILRLKVCIDIARGLKFLHEGDVGQDVVIHRDIKSSNILLTMDWKAKIYGFKDAPSDDVVGLSACLDPSYYNKKDLTKESDIYSFGVVLFEILFGSMVFPDENSDDKRMLDYLVKSVKIQAARVEELVFEELKKHIVQKSFTIFRRIAIQCLHERREERPRAGDVLEELQKALKFQEDYEERKAKLDRIYKNIPPTVSEYDKLFIYNVLSKELLHEDDKLIAHHQSKA
ncbi:hypothetical protein R6Q59_023380 [Mikania micrantha]